MTPLTWLILFMLAPVAFPSSVIHLLRRRWPFNVTQGEPGEPRARVFARIIGGSLVFGSVFGLFAGCVATAAWLLQSHVLSK
jgi:hypothetical protein